MINDFHIHTCFSGDSTADVDDVITSAINKGMSHIAITDHNDYDYEGGTFELDIERYFDLMTKKKAEYKNDIAISIGIECGLEPRFADRINSLIASYNFDFVIGSSHVVNGRDPYYKEYFEYRSTHDAMVEYFNSILENINTFSNFDVYGHIDYAMRYAPISTEEKHYDYTEYESHLDNILNTLIKMGKGIEINTSSLRKGLLDANPNLQVVKRYKELGGDVITVGSDAHTASDIGADFNIAKDMLLSSGFTNYTIFSERKPQKMHI